MVTAGVPTRGILGIALGNVLAAAAEIVPVSSQDGLLVLERTREIVESMIGAIFIIPTPLVLRGGTEIVRMNGEMLRTTLLTLDGIATGVRDSRCSG